MIQILKYTFTLTSLSSLTTLRLYNFTNFHINLDNILAETLQIDITLIRFEFHHHSVYHLSNLISQTVSVQTRAFVYILVSARLVMACLVSSRLCLTWLVSAHLGLAHLVSAWNTSTLMTKVIQLPSSLKLKFVSSACLVLSCLCLAWRVSARLGSSRLGSSLG